MFTCEWGWKALKLGESLIHCEEALHDTVDENENICLLHYFLNRTIIICCPSITAEHRPLIFSLNFFYGKTLWGSSPQQSEQIYINRKENKSRNKTEHLKKEGRRGRGKEKGKGKRTKPREGTTIQRS